MKSSIYFYLSTLSSPNTDYLLECPMLSQFYIQTWNERDPDNLLLLGYSLFECEHHLSPKMSKIICDSYQTQSDT